SLLLACAGIALVWLIRRPLRRLTGAGPAFCLWALVPALAGVAWLPQAIRHTRPVFTLPMIVQAGPIMVDPATASHTPSLVSMAFVVWLVGTALMLARLAWYSLRLHRDARVLPRALRVALGTLLGDDTLRHARVHPAGPAVCWLPHCRLLLPADLATRFNHDELSQVLAHERMHLARRDPLWSLAAEIMLAALWFFPPAWLAMRGFRLDQELACDAAVMRDAPATAGRYARALLTSATAPRAPAALTLWLTASQLKERLRMLPAHARSPLARRSGYATLAVLLAGLALAAHAALPVPAPSRQDTTHPTTASPEVVMSYRHRHPPIYPVSAQKNHQQGVVTLLVEVGTDGKPLAVKVARSSGTASLDEAASNAARQWRFNPGTKNGKPVVGWARIHVNFTLDDSQTATGKLSPPVLVEPYQRRPPVYPASARKNHQQGTVTLRVKVGTNGKPLDIRVARSSGVASLDASARNVARQWRFNPETQNGKPVAGWVEITVNFSLDEAKAVP
ncbi:MAG TPA: TonB family protein, partial [Rhodanobacteraceae bacterium]